MKSILLAALVVAVLTACAVRMYGNLRCDGPCELTLDREVGELEIIPDPIDKIKPKGK